MTVKEVLCGNVGSVLRFAKRLPRPPAAEAGSGQLSRIPLVAGTVHKLGMEAWTKVNKSRIACKAYLYRLALLTRPGFKGHDFYGLYPERRAVREMETPGRLNQHPQVIGATPAFIVAFSFPLEATQLAYFLKGKIEDGLAQPFHG